MRKVICSRHDLRIVYFSLQTFLVWTLRHMSEIYVERGSNSWSVVSSHKDAFPTFFFRSWKCEVHVSGALARNMSVTGIDLRHTSISVLNMRASHFKKHACLALDSISGPPNVRNTHVLPGIRSCSSS